VKLNKANFVRITRRDCNYSSDKSANSIYASQRDRKIIMTVPVNTGKVLKNLEFQHDTAATCNML